MKTAVEFQVSRTHEASLEVEVKKQEGSTSNGMAKIHRFDLILVILFKILQHQPDLLLASQILFCLRRMHERRLCLPLMM